MCSRTCFCFSCREVVRYSCPERAQYIRVIFAEITRIFESFVGLLQRMLWMLGALTPFLWAFEEREKLMEFYERALVLDCMQLIFDQVGLLFDLPPGFCVYDLFVFVNNFFDRLIDIEELLSSNRIGNKD
jgi:NADH dehydrogenase (ubiquinone) Fe-S protein 2